jgi:hypothetical protein
MYLGDLGAITGPTTGIRTTPWPTITSTVSSGRGIQTGLYDRWVTQGSGRGTVTVPGTPVVRDPGYSSFDLAQVKPFIAANESALPGTPGTLRWRDSDYIYYKRARKPAKRLLYQRLLVNTGTREGGQEYHDSVISVYDGDPFSDGFDISKREVKGVFALSNILGVVAMIAVGGAMILAAQAAQAAAAAGTAASAGTSAGSASTVAATTSATTGGTAAGTSGITMSATTAATGGATAGGTAAAGTAAGGLTTGGVVKSATALYSAVKPIVSAGSAVMKAVDALKQQKEQEEAAKAAAAQEAAYMEQYAREMQAYSAQQSQHASSLTTRANAGISMFALAVALAGVAFYVSKRKPKGR